ncbi:hypothetical protein CPB85DRAFT_1252515 [Mucidula mucida]|nr:hypothetical protein CPB85DRAFT_1252515 [Mucidula mucida]
MAEILRTVATIISLVELTSTAVRYLKVIKDAPKECQDICCKLHILETYAVCSFKELNRLGGPIQELFFELKNLETHVKPKQKIKLFRNCIMWVVLGKKEMEALLKNLDLKIKRDIKGTGVELLDLHVEFQMTLMLKSIEVGNKLSVIGQARNHNNMRQWIYHTICLYARDAKLKAIVLGIISSPNFSNFSIPEGILSRGSEFQFKGWLKAIPLDDFSYSPDLNKFPGHAETRVLDPAGDLGYSTRLIRGSIASRVINGSQVGHLSGEYSL